MKALVLTYHSHNISGRDYATNDHLAFASDIRTLTEMEAQIVPLATIVSALSRGVIDGRRGVAVGVTFDDGPLFDYEDFVHPEFGPQRAFLNVMRDFVDEFGSAAQSQLHATSFVIASAEARRAMERAEDCGYPYIEGWLSDAWWNAAIDTGLMAIGNHSWDHVHHAVPRIAAKTDVRDDFARVDNWQDADLEIRAAGDQIRARTENRCEYFAFPFGHVNRYMLEEYLPRFTHQHRMKAAFGVDGRCLSATDSIWNIPRMVCGHHWRSPEELKTILRT